MSTFEVKPVHRLRQQVEAQLLEAIVSGRLADGDKLPAEAELAEMFSVSRSTIREALRSLASAGLIDKVPGATGGSFVRELDGSRFGNQLADLIQLVIRVGTAQRSEVAALRAMLEIPACRLAAENRSESDIETLRSILEAQKRGSVTDPDIAELDMSFHASIAKASGNTVLASFVHALHSVSQPVKLVELSKEAGRETVRQHAAVVQAIEAADPDAAEAAIREHLEYLGGLRPRRADH